MRRALTTLMPVAALTVCLTLGSAHAIVPPRDCGRMTVSHKKWRIKADQLSCKTARKHAKYYIVRKKSPTGYRCRRYKESSLYARCVNRRANPDRTIFIIKQ